MNQLSIRAAAIVPLLAAVASFGLEEKPAPKPNIVFILADDLGYTDLGCQGSKYYESPNIDGLAARGMRFTSGYTCGPNCQPTRAALMSGQYGPRTGVYTVGSIDRFDWRSRPLRPVDNVEDLPLDKITVAQALKAAGYATGMFGKWHLGHGAKHHPSQRGFDEAIVSQGEHFNFQTRPRTDYPPGTYLADFLTDKAVDFIQRHKDEPFFLYLPHFGVHSPHEAKSELIARFKDKAGTGGHDNPTYAAMIASVDDSVGRIAKTLEDLGLTERTLVIFSSDNGGVGGYREAGIPTKDGITNNAPLRGGKGMLYEGGIRVPYIFAWPGRIAPGTESSAPILSVDLYPTLLELAGASAPSEYVLDGVCYLPHLLGGSAKPLQEREIYWHFPGYLGAGKNSWRTKPVGVVRKGDWKLIEFFEDGRLELYNTRADISEKNNLAGEKAELASELRAALVAWRDRVGARMPTPRAEAAADDAPPAKRNKREKGDKPRKAKKGKLSLVD